MKSRSKHNRRTTTGSDLPWQHPEVEMTFFRMAQLIHTGEADPSPWEFVPIDYEKPTPEMDAAIVEELKEAEKLSLEVKVTRRHCPDCGYYLSIKSSCCPSGRMWVCLECAWTETFRGR